jgi:hypothetical protein
MQHFAGKSPPDPRAVRLAPICRVLLLSLVADMAYIGLDLPLD